MKTCPTCQASYPDDLKVCPKDGFVLQTSTELSPGTVLRGKYEILARIGVGGMGTVYKARHLHFDEIWALKVVTPDLGADEEFLARFRAEALLMRRLSHPNAVRVHDFDVTEDGSSFMVMEYVEGTSLEQLVAGGNPLDPVRVARIGMQVCGALGAAHELGIIHRDVKPGNILIATAANGSEVAKVLDFGVAKVKDNSSFQAAAKTAVGFIVGTPTYMSPEQVMGLRGDKLDGRSDLYSLGIVLYELLTGQPPFVSKKQMALLTAHMQTKPADPRNVRPDLPAPLVEIILKALEKEPANRFSSAEEMSEALRDFLKSAPAEMQKKAAVSAMKPQVIPAPTPTERTEVQGKTSEAPVAARPAVAPHAAPAVSPPLADTVRIAAPTPPPSTRPARFVSAGRSSKASLARTVSLRRSPSWMSWLKALAVIVAVAAVLATAYFLWLKFHPVSPGPEKSSVTSSTRRGPGLQAGILPESLNPAAITFLPQARRD